LLIATSFVVVRSFIIEQEKERKRIARVKKLKKKINGYRDEIKTEAERIQELINIGIDPESLLV
jgi:hypothetical protein